VFIVIESSTQKVIDYECGNRNKPTFNRLFKRLKRHTIGVISTDEYRVYNKINEEYTHTNTKNLTTNIESFNSIPRGFLGRFHRKTKIVSKCKDMVVNMLHLFFLFRNRNIKKLSDYMNFIYIFATDFKHKRKREVVCV
jgi:IS1 family transposase